MQQNETALDRLETLVLETAAAVRIGNLAIMGDLAHRTEAILAELEGDADVTRLEALRRLAERNALGLEAAGRGVRAARRRLAEISAVHKGLQTYDKIGKTKKIDVPAGTLKTRL
jgi:hypothetical protein